MGMYPSRRERTFSQVPPLVSTSGKGRAENQVRTSQTELREAI